MAGGGPFKSLYSLFAFYVEILHDFLAGVDFLENIVPESIFLPLHVI
jgi:hypothetical protein